MKQLFLSALILLLIGCQTKSAETNEATTDTVATAPAIPYGEVKAEVCTYKDYIVGDCVHIDFSCGDFGAAQRNQLDTASLKLWSGLSVEDSTGYEVPNPLYIGKQFEIRFNYTKASACQDPSEPEKEVEVANILSFKLVNP